MTPRNAIRSFLSLLLLIPMMLLTGLTACSKSKNSGGTAAALAPIQGSSDGSASGSDDDSDESSSSADDCEKEGEDEAEAEEEGQNEDDVDEKAALKNEKAEKGQKTPKVCPVPGTATPAAAGTASLAEGQKLYAANCQGCHGALPGEEQGASAATILNASGVGAHKGITPWPAGAGSALSAQDAAASLAAAMK